MCLEVANKTYKLSLLYLPNNPEESIKWKMRSADLILAHAQRDQGVVEDPKKKETLPQTITNQGAALEEDDDEIQAGLASIFKPEPPMKKRPPKKQPR